MNPIAACVALAGVFVIVMVVKIGCQLYANNKRIERGEPPKKYHDVTDHHTISVIDWTQIRRKS